MIEHPVVYFRGEFVPLAEAKVGIRAKALHYGLGCFEGIRGYWNAEAKQLYLFRLREHYERLRQSCKILNLPLKLSVEEMVEITLELCRRNEHREDSYIRPIVYNVSELLAPSITPNDNEFAVYTIVLRDYFSASKGITACVSSWRRVADNMIPARAKPTAAYLNSALARQEAAANGCDEAIFLTNDGYVSEGSAEHIFLVCGGRLITPTSQEDNLDGITRRTILETVPKLLNREVVERRVSRTELYVADEVFLCGTGAQVTPVVEIDRRRVGDGKIGPVTHDVQQLYFKTVRAELSAYAHWCTPVY